MATNTMEWMVANCIPSKEARAKEKMQVYHEGYYKKNSSRLKREDRKAREALTDAYLARRLSVRLKDAPQELLVLKREQMQMSRLSKGLEQVIVELKNE